MQKRPTEQTQRCACDFPAKVAVIIPAWQPRQELITLVHALQQRGCRAILVVDDGSHADCRPVFEQLQRIPGVCVLRHERNRGKGRALKTALGHFLENFSEYIGVVTADADGQHAADDITRIAAAIVEQPRKIILGSRQADAAMPLRSRFGNWLTRYVFRIAAGVKLADTQTGLRGFPRETAAQLLTVDGERYEYETAVLLHSCRSGRVPVEIPIRTIYQAGNRSSHFRPVTDSIQIYKVIASYCFHHSRRPQHAQQERGRPSAESIS